MELDAKVNSELTKGAACGECYTARSRRDGASASEGGALVTRLRGGRDFSSFVLCRTCNFSQANMDLR